MTSNEFLYRRIGQRIEEGHIELFFDRDRAARVNAFWLRFQAGRSLAFGCAGDGGIFSRKAEPHVGTISHCGRVQLQPVSFLTGARLESVESGVDQLTIQTSLGSVILRNVCDELTVEFSNAAGVA